MYHASRSKGKREYKGSDRKRYIKAKSLRAKSWKNVKLWAVKQYENGMAVKRTADILGVSKSVYNWIKLYKTQGKDAFNPKSKNLNTQRSSQKSSQRRSWSSERAPIMAVRR